MFGNNSDDMVRFDSSTAAEAYAERKEDAEIRREQSGGKVKYAVRVNSDGGARFDQRQRERNRSGMNDLPGSSSGSLFGSGGSERKTFSEIGDELRDVFGGAGDGGEEFGLRTGRFRGRDDGEFNDGTAEDFDFGARRFRDDDGAFKDTPPNPTREGESGGLFDKFSPPWR
jgi:hypothetical protein